MALALQILTLGLKLAPAIRVVTVELLAAISDGDEARSRQAYEKVRRELLLVRAENRRG